MPYNNIDDGLYLVKQPGAEVKGFPVTHFGIIDIGNILQNPQVDSSIAPTVIHQTPPEVRLDYISSNRPWEIVNRITDVEAAEDRIKKAVEDKDYDLFENNCEHFAKFVAKGDKSSGQVIIGVTTAIGAVALFITACVWFVKKK